MDFSRLSRRPREAYRNPFSAYVQTAIAVEPHRKENGALRLYPGSHKLGPLEFPIRGRVSGQIHPSKRPAYRRAYRVA